jgi:Flp pilus assembly protein TadG
MSARSTSIRRFSEDGRGVAIVEFAMLAPLLILFYIGMAEICQGLMAERRTHHATSAIGDLVAQAAQVNATEVGEVFMIGGVIFEPYPTEGRLRLRVSSVKVDPQGVPKVTWSEARDWTERGQQSVVDLPEVPSSGGGSADFLRPGESAIMAEAEYEFVTPFSELFSWLIQYLGGASATRAGGFEYESTYYLRPRRSEEVNCPTCMN